MNNEICKSIEILLVEDNPVDFDQFMKVVQSIEDFWLTVVKLPCRAFPGRS